MNPFTYENYKHIITKMKEINTIYEFKDIDNNIKNGFLLRHDVDLDILKAVNIFEIEKHMEIKSTYFILTTCDYYNINSKIIRYHLKNISDNGFEVALHFDPTIYGDISINEMNKKVRLESSIIEDITGKKVQSISIHNPSIHNQYPIFKGYNNVYSKEFFNPNLYLSDSCKDFRGKEIFEFIKKGKSDLLQVLFHPIHFSEKGETYIESFNKLIENKINKFDKNMYANKTYKVEIGESTLLAQFLKNMAEGVTKHEKNF